MQATRSEAFVSFDGAEKVGIRALWLGNRKYWQHFKLRRPLNFWQLFRGAHAPSRAGRGALAANLSASKCTHRIRIRAIGEGANRSTRGRVRSPELPLSS